MRYFIVILLMTIGLNNCFASEYEYGLQNIKPWGFNGLLDVLGLSDDEDSISDERYESQDFKNIPYIYNDGSQNSVILTNSVQIPSPYPVINNLTDFFKRVNEITALKQITPEEVLVWLDWDYTVGFDNATDCDSLLDHNTISIVNAELAKGYRIIINTARGYHLNECSNTLTHIAEIEAHHKRMSNTGLTFSTLSANKSFISIRTGIQGYYEPIFYKGILFAGMEKFLALTGLLFEVEFEPKLTFGLDDNLEHLIKFPKVSQYQLFHFQRLGA